MKRQLQIWRRIIWSFPDLKLKSATEETPGLTRALNEEFRPDYSGYYDAGTKWLSDMPENPGTEQCANLFLSARTKESDKTLGFSSGGDDYLAKPFSYNELISRSKALIRRYQVYKGKNESCNQSINSASVNPTADPIASTSNASDSRHRILLFHDLEINQTVREVHKNGQLLDLTETEYSMLELLVANRHQTFSAQRLLSLSGRSLITTVQIILSPYIFETYAPKWKINPGNPELIKTVWGKRVSLRTNNFH